MVLPARVPTFAELPIRGDTPPRSNWGVFGLDDQLGTLNFITPDRRLAAAALVRRRESFSLDLPLNLPIQPMFPVRTLYRHTIMRRPGSYGRDDVLDNFHLQAAASGTR